MGVLACSRRGCENIMCDTYVDSIGYICEDCKKQFKSFIGGMSNITDESIMDRLESFVMIPVNHVDWCEADKLADDFFDRHK